MADLFLSDAEIIHIGGQAMNQAADKRIILKYKGQYRFYRKHYPLWKYICLRLIITGIAIPQIALLFIFYVFSRLQKKQIITNGNPHAEPVKTGPGLCNLVEDFMASILGI